VICPTCGADNAPGAAYCYNCSNPLPQVAGGQQWTTPPTQPGTPVPPGPPSQPPTYPGAFQPGPPVEPPRGPFRAGIAALVGFVVVLAIGLLVFFVFLKGGKPEVEPTQPPTTAPTTTAPVSSAPTTEPPTSGATTKSQPPTTKKDGGGGKNSKTPAVIVLVCRSSSGGLCIGSGFERKTIDTRVVVLITMFNFGRGHNIVSDVVDPATGVELLGPFSGCVTNGLPKVHCRFPIAFRPGVRPREGAQLEVLIKADGIQITIANGNGPNGSVLVTYTDAAPV